jgi:hypothetical protein
MAIAFRKPRLAFYKVCDRLNESFHCPGLIRLSDDICYVDIPKVASSFVKSAFLYSKSDFVGAGPLYPHSNIFPRIHLSEINQFTRMLCFWKDPIERFCSVIREKMFCNSRPVCWSPFSVPLFARRFSVDSVEIMIESIVECPYALVDKHILPQFLFSARYSALPCFEHIPVSLLSSSLVSIGISEEFFPDSRVALNTDKRLFSSCMLSKRARTLLCQYYELDYLSSPDSR